MTKSTNSILETLRRSVATVDDSSKKLDELKINQGVMLARLNEREHSTNLQHYEFRVFSQWGEDGIIQHLVRAVEIGERTFIEFGVEDFSESNCRFLLMKDNWNGFVIDGSVNNISKLRSSYYYWMHDLKAVDSFITKENINQLLSQSEFSEDLGILSVDLDGNDYHIFEAIEGVRPRIVICEYNAVFGPTRSISVPYDPSFVRRRAHYSCLYYGASLAAMTHIARRKGYSLVGTNSAGNNAFFVRDDLVNERIEVLDPVEAFSVSKFRESRDPEGNLTYTAGDQRIELIRGLPVLNVQTNAIETL